MAQRLKQRHYDVVVVGGGASGVATAIGAAKNGGSTLLIDAGPMLGGELLSGIGIAGCINARGEWIVNGVMREIIDDVRAVRIDKLRARLKEQGAVIDGTR